MSDEHITFGEYHVREFIVDEVRDNWSIVCYRNNEGERVYVRPYGKKPDYMKKLDKERYEAILQAYPDKGSS